MIDFLSAGAPWSLGEFSLIPARHLPLCADLGCRFRFVSMLPGGIVFEHHTADGQMRGFWVSPEDLADVTIDIWAPIERKIVQLHEEQA